MLLDNLQMPVWPRTTLPHQVLHTAPRRHRLHTLAFCQSTQTVRAPLVYLDVRSTGILLIVLERFSLAAS